MILSATLPMHVPMKPIFALSALTLAMVLLLPLSPAQALERGTFADVVVPSGQRESEVSTIVGDVKVKGLVAGDVSSANGDVLIDGPVGGRVRSGWGDIYVHQPVGNGIQAGFGDVHINAPVSGDVDVEHGDVYLGPKALVAGNLRCGSGEIQGNTYLVQGSVISGMASDLDRPGRDLRLLGFIGWMFAALGFTAFCLLVAVLAPGPVSAASRRLEASPGWSLLLGIGSLPAAIVLFVLLAISVVGIPLMLLLAPVYLALVLFGALVSAFFIGRKLVLATGRHRAGNALAVVVGALIVAATYLIPFFGNLLLYALALLGTGAAILSLFSRRGRRSYLPYDPYAREGREV